MIELSDVFRDAELEGTCSGPSLLITKFLDSSSLLKCGGNQ